MNILIFGAGVQGQFLAHAINKRENNITILAKGETYKNLESRGVVINHYIQKKKTIDHFNYINELKETDEYDIIFVTMKYSDYYSIIPQLSKNITQNIIFVGNNTNPQKIREIVQKQSKILKNIAFGFLMIGGNRSNSKTTVLRLNAGELKISYLEGRVLFQNKIDKIFKGLPIKLKYQKNFENWLMSHAATIIPLNIGIELKDRARMNQKNLIHDVLKAYKEINLLIEENNYKIVPKVQDILFKKCTFLIYPLLKVIFNIKIMNLMQGSMHEIETLYADIKLLKDNTVLSTKYLDKIVKEIEVKN